MNLYVCMYVPEMILLKTYRFLIQMTQDALHIQTGFIEKYIKLNTSILIFLTTFYQL